MCSNSALMGPFFWGKQKDEGSSFNDDLSLPLDIMFYVVDCNLKKIQDYGFILLVLVLEK